ncbi:hypothetical protein [Roseitranquillus sediminis]|uniref:hypothetical protein n=1 Tax=Roseitranquillus sediminis TaxID=2809051 RepID=UPI001D0C4B3F|nr:hypothetical protein [Roseitranquillus sediminis]MBM9595240.1 hypothetical protein [Roseitranquillus sediminis]
MPLLDRRQQALAAWWARRVVQFALALVTSFFLTLSLARVLGISAVDWPGVAGWVLGRYGDLLVWAGRTILWLISIVPPWFFDLVALYLLVGALVRIAVAEIALRSERAFYDRPLDVWDDAWHRDGIAQAREAGRVESARFYLLWPVRVLSDIRGGYWTLTPRRVAVRFGLVLLLLAALTVA